MDKLINTAEQYLNKGNRNDEPQRLPGGNNAHGGNYPAGGGFSGGSDEDEFRRAQEEASRRAGDSGSSDFFSSIMSNIGQKKGQLENEDIDEDDAVQSHRHAYDDTKQTSDSGVGKAAALQALKMFNQGGGGSSSSGGGGGQSQGAFIGMAMSEASKLFDAKASQGNLSGGSSKESAVQQAGEMALKMYMKSQGGSSGGLMSLASKFM